MTRRQRLLGLRALLSAARSAEPSEIEWCLEAPEIETATEMDMLIEIIARVGLLCADQRQRASKDVKAWAEWGRVATALDRSAGALSAFRWSVARGAKPSKRGAR